METQMETQMDNQNPIVLQHKALVGLIKDTYKLNFKNLLSDLAEIVETESDNQKLIEGMWECALMLPMDPNRPE